MRKYLLIFLMGLFTQPLLAQEKPLKERFEEHYKSKYALYASTLRMINITGDEEINQMVNGIEKVLIYQIDSASLAEKSFLQINKDYLEEGFEEYAAMYGGNRYMSILGDDKEFVGYMGDSQEIFVFYLRGKIAWEKIPVLVTTLKDGSFLNFLEIKN